MASVFASNAGPAASFRPIGSYRRTALSRRTLRWSYIGLAVAAAIYGFAFALFGELNIVGFMIPIGLLGAVAMWTMPQLRYPPVRAMVALLPVFLYALLCWPDYLAFAPANLPWITAIRLAGIPMAILLLICAFGSPAFRARMSDIFNGDRLIVRLIIGFIIVAGLSIALSSDMGYSLSKYVIVAWSWYGVFVVSCYYFSKPGAPLRFTYMLLPIILLSVGIAIYETTYRHLPWAGHIPSFLEIDDPKIRKLLAGTQRAAGGTYRVQSKFSTSIGLGEFFGLTLPFVMHLMFTTRKIWAKALLFLLILVSLDVVLETDSRLAFVSFVLSLMLYILFHAFTTWRRRKTSLFAPAVMMIYPLGMVLFGVLALTWRRLEVLVFGGGAQQYSTIARQIQWGIGWPKILRNPFGYGLGLSPQTLNFHTPGTFQQTIDSYYLGVLLEIGVIGFLLYYGIFVVAMVQAGRAAIETEDKDIVFLGATTVALINYLVSKSIYSQLENNPLVFILLGMVVALLRRYKAQTGELPPLPEDDDAFLKPRRPRGRPARIGPISASPT